MEGIGHQQLLFPLKINISKNDIIIVKQIEQDLNSAGFHISEIQEDALVLDPFQQLSLKRKLLVSWNL